MMQGDTLPSFGGEHREISALFTDIADFTTMAETMEAATVAELLGDYFGVLTDVVVKNGGLVNDFIGDGLRSVRRSDPPGRPRQPRRSRRSGHGRGSPAL